MIVVILVMVVLVVTLVGMKISAAIISMVQVFAFLLGDDRRTKEGIKKKGKQERK